MVHQITPEDPDDLAAEVLRHLEWMRIRGYSDGTIYAREGRLGDFVAWCAERELRKPHELSHTVLELYQRHLANRRKSNGKAISLQTQSFILTAVKGFCSWLARQRLVAYNPAAELEMPRTVSRIPREVLSPAEAEQILAVPDVATPFGLRDRAILETLYSTGIRRGELVRLEIHDMDMGRGVLLIRQGKNRKDRLVPIGERALAWIRKYIDDSRPVLVLPPDDGVLFLTHLGKPFLANSVSRLVSKLVKQSGVQKQGSAHMFRHTMATAMLEGGADIRYIQQMLGHSSLNTTQVYTQVAVKQLKEIHETTHPGARLNRPQQMAAKERRPGPAILLDEEDEDLHVN